MTSEPTESTTDPIIGRLIDGRYQVRSRIARGGMATVYLATDLRLERRVAIKVMHAHLADDQAFAQRFIQEARSAARLAHPNVVNVFDQGEDGETAYMVMEYLPGITLRELLKDYHRLTPEQTLDIMDAVLAGLAAAHHAGIVHRDLKPENVMLADDGRIKLADFGLARAATANTATGQALLGTIAYLSPELVSRGTADARSDVYALGIMMYEMLTGEQPYRGDAPMQIAFQHANDTVPPPSSKVPGLPRGFDDLVEWATQKNPEDRPADAREMLEKLREFEASLSGDDDVNVTMVMPRASVQTQETQVLRGSVAPSTTTASEVGLTGNALLLSRSSAARRRRGKWWLIMLVLLASLSAGTGWWWGYGPGSYLEVPSVAGLEPAVASQKIVEAGFVAEQRQVNDATVPAGAVVATDPPSGARAPRDSVVTVLVSLGPRMLDFPSVVGASEDAARELLADFTLAPSTNEFAAGVPSGHVIRALGADGAEIGETYPEKGQVTLIVSLGPIPDVVGKTLDDANRMLTTAGLVGAVASEEFSETVAKGSVISASPATEPVVPGGTINMVVSKGVDLVVVPDVAGKPMTEAIQILKDAGFQVSYALNEQLINLATVVSTDPAGGTEAKRGSIINIRASITV